MSFSSEIKKEVILNKKNKQQKKFFLLGFIFANTLIINNSYIITFKNKTYLNIIFELLELFKIKYIFFENSQNKISILDKAIFKNYPKNDFTNFMAGVFLSGGSINNFKISSYHLELKINSEKFANLILNDLYKHNLVFKLFKRNNRIILYIKKSEMISDFLKAINAIKNYFKFEDAKIERDYTNYENRFVNLSVLNQKKLIEANFKHTKNYNFILKNNLEFLFRQEELDFFELKKTNRFDSLETLRVKFFDKYNIQKSKGAFNHYLRKLKLIVDKYNKKD